MNGGAGRWRGARAGTILAAIAVAAAMTSCSSGTSSTSGTSGTSSPSGTSGTAATSSPGGSGSVQGGSLTHDVTNYASFTLSKPGKANASLTPYLIGWVNNQGGLESFPGATVGAQVAVDVVNNELGGVDGHPLKLSTCYIVNSVQEGTTCGNQMVNTSAVKVIDMGTVVIGNQPFHAAIAGAKPVIFSTAVDPSDGVCTGCVIYIGDLVHALSPAGPFAKDYLHATSAAVIYRDNAGNIQQGQAYATGYQKAGLNVKSVAFSPQETDLLPPLTAAGGQTASVTSLATDATGCIPFAKALAQSGSKTQPIINPLCFNVALKPGYPGGDYPKGWIEGTAGVLPQDVSDPGVALYRQKMAQYGASASVEDVFAQISYASILTTLRLINEAGGMKATPAEIANAARAFKGPLPMGPPTENCGQVPSAPAVCNTDGIFYRYAGGGRFVRLTGWIPSP